MATPETQDEPTTLPRDLAPADRLTPGLPVLLVLRRSWFIILAVAACAVAGSVAFSSTTADKYDASASLSLSDAPYEQALIGGPPGGDPIRQLTTVANLVQLPVVSDAAAADTTRDNPKASLYGVHASVSQDSNVIRVTAQADSSSAAAAFANATVDRLLAFRRRQNASTLAATQRVLREQIRNAPTGGQRRALVGKVNNLNVLQTILDQQLQVVDSARTTGTASSRNDMIRNAAIALVIGLLLGVAVSLLRGSSVAAASGK